MPAQKRKHSSSKGNAKKKRKLGKPKPTERLELHSKQLRLNEQNLRSASTLSSDAPTNQDPDHDELPQIRDFQVATYRKLTLNDIFNKLSHYSSKESSIALDQLAELLRRFPKQMRIHQYDISKKIVTCITEKDDPQVRTAAIRVLDALFRMMTDQSASSSASSSSDVALLAKQDSMATASSGLMIEQVLMKLFVSCVCTIMSDMFVRMRAFGIDVTLMLIEYFPQTMAAHAYKLLPTLENLFLMTKIGHSYKGENYKIIHERAIKCLNRLTFILFQYGGSESLRLDESDIHTHCHTQVNLKQLTRDTGATFSHEEQQFMVKQQKRANEADFYDTSHLYQSFANPGKHNLNTFLDIMTKRESEKSRLEAIEVTLSSIFTAEDNVAEGLLYSLDSSYSLYKFCDRMFGTLKDKWVEVIHKGGKIQTFQQATHMKHLLQLMYNICYAIEHQNGVQYEQEIMRYLQNALHHLVRHIPLEFSMKLEASAEMKNRNAENSKKDGEGNVPLQKEGSPVTVSEINSLLIGLLSFACCWRLSKKGNLQKATTLMRWEQLYINFFEERIQSFDISHHDFGVLIGAFHRMERQLPTNYREQVWSVLTKIFLREKTLSVRQRLLLHYLGDVALEETDRLPPKHMLEQWVHRIAKMLATIPDSKLSLMEKLLRVIRCFSLRPEFEEFLNGPILEAIPEFFFNSKRQVSTFSKLSIEFQQQSVHLLHHFSSFPVNLIRALSKACSDKNVPARIVTQIIETLRFKQDTLDTKSHVGFLVSLITGLTRRSADTSAEAPTFSTSLDQKDEVSHTFSDQDTILHEIIINIYSQRDPKTTLSCMIPIFESFFDREDISTDMYCILLKVAMSAFNATKDDAPKSGDLWEFTIPEVLVDILCDASASEKQVRCVYEVLLSNEEQFYFALKNMQERLQEEDEDEKQAVVDLTRAFSRLIEELQQLKRLFLSQKEMSLLVCRCLKEKNPSKKDLTSMESKMKFLFEQE